MTGRERLLTTLKSEKADRIPVSPFLYLNSVYEMFGYEPDIDNYWEPPDFDVIGKFVDYCDYFGFDILNPLPMVWDMYAMNSAVDKPLFVSAENWDVDIADCRKDNQKHRTINISTPEGQLKCVENYSKISKYLVVSATEEYLIKTKRDFEVFRRFSPPASKVDCDKIRKAKEAIGDKGLVAPIVAGAFTVLNVVRKLEDVFMDPITDEAFYREMIGFFLERLIARVKEMVEAGADVIEIGGNIAGSSVGEQFFRDYVFEYQNRYLKAIQDAGALTILHNCGDADKVMHIYNDMHINCWGYLTPPPFGDVDIDRALETIRPDMCLRGNIDQVVFLKTATPEQVTERVKKLIAKVKPRGNWILSTTDFFSDDTPYENIEAFVKTGLEYGIY